MEKKERKKKGKGDFFFARRSQEGGRGGGSRKTCLSISCAKVRGGGRDITGGEKRGKVLFTSPGSKKKKGLKIHETFSCT